MLMPISACPGPGRAAFDLVASSGPVDTTTDLTLAQISELAIRSGRLGKHPPLGFYIGKFGYTVGVDVSAYSEGDCPKPVRVTIALMLTDRHIEIGRELVAKPCFFSAARDHYLRHAAMDETVLTEFAWALEAALRRVPLPEMGHDETLAEADRQRIEQAVTSVVELGLSALDGARANARDQVNTLEEVRKLSEACALGGR